MEKTSNDTCAECGVPLRPIYPNILITIHQDGTATSSYVCFACDAMHGAAATPYFDRLEIEYGRTLREIKRLKPGANYLE